MIFLTDNPKCQLSTLLSRIGNDRLHHYRKKYDMNKIHFIPKEFNTTQYIYYIYFFSINVMVITNIPTGGKNAPSDVIYFTNNAEYRFYASSELISV